MTEVQVCHCLMCLALAPLGWCLLLFDVGYSICSDIADIRMLSFLEILTWLMVELPFSVRVEDGTPVSVETLQIAQLLKKELRIFELEH